MPQVFVSAGFVTGVILTVAASWTELISRKGNSGEHLTWIFRSTRVVAAFFVRNTVIQYRNNKLCGTLQPDDGKLPQCDKQSALVTGENQLLIEQSANRTGNLANRFCAAAITDILDFGTKHHGIQHFDYCGRQIGTEAGQSVRTADDGIAAENMGMAVLAAQDCPLGKRGKAIKTGRTSGTNNRVCQNLIVKRNVDTVVIAVECNGFYINIGIQKFGTADSGIGSGVQNCLRSCG